MVRLSPNRLAPPEEQITPHLLAELVELRAGGGRAAGSADAGMQRQLACGQVFDHKRKACAASG